LAGRVNRYNVGALNIQQDNNGDLSGENLTVARVSANVLRESSVGVLMTHGDPNSREENLLAAADFNYRSSQLIRDRFVTGSLWVQQDFRGDNYSKRSTAWGGTLAYPNDEFNWRIRVKDIEEGFDPALGFVNRSDIRSYDLDYRYRFRFQGGDVRTVDLVLDSSLTTDRDDNVESAAVFVSPFRITSQVEDSIELRYVLLYEDTQFPFYTLADHIGIPPGQYTQHSAVVDLKTSQYRPVRFELTVGYGQFFDGTGLRIAPLVEWRPSKYLLFSLQYDERRFRNIESCKSFPGVNCVQGSLGGDVENRPFEIRLARLRAQVAFSPDISWSTLAQYDNQTDKVQVQTRLRWIIEPGREFFVVVGQGFDAIPGDFRVRRTEAIFKLRWTFRF
jgi:hypothetical protein